MKYSLFYLYMIKPLPLNQCENIQNALQHHQMSPLEDDSPFGSASSSSGNKNFFQTTICVTTIFQYSLLTMIGEWMKYTRNWIDIGIYNIPCLFVWQLPDLKVNASLSWKVSDTPGILTEKKQRIKINVVSWRLRWLVRLGTTEFIPK